MEEGGSGSEEKGDGDVEWGLRKGRARGGGVMVKGRKRKAEEVENV